MKISEWLHWLGLGIAGTLLYFLFDWGYLSLWQGVALFVVCVGLALWFDRHKQADPNSTVGHKAATKGDNSPAIAAIQQGGSGNVQNVALGDIHQHYGPPPSVDSKRGRKPGRIFVPRTVRELIEIVNSDQLDFRKNAALEPFIGKWIEIKEPIHNITTHASGGVTVTVRIDRTDVSLLWDSLYLEFGSSHVGSITVLDRGDQITAIGKIDNFNGGSVRLTDCELLDVQPKTQGA